MSTYLRNQFHHIFLFVLAGLCVSCAYSIHEVQVADFVQPVQAPHKDIEAKTDQFVILGFAFDTNYVDAAYDKLKEQCRGGAIDGVTTKYSTALGFFSWHNRILVKGRCFQKT